MRTICISLAALVLGACATVPQSTHAVEVVGTDLFSVSQRNVPFGSPIDVAGSFCADFGQNVQIEGNTTEQTVLSDQVYSVLVFRCV